MTIPPNMTQEALWELLRTAADNLERAHRDRDTLILHASAAGMSRRWVAGAVGLTAGRVQHIVTEARQDGWKGRV